MNISPNTLYYKPVDWKAKDAPVLRMIQAFLEKLPASGVPFSPDWLIRVSLLLVNSNDIPLVAKYAIKLLVI